MSKIVFRVQFRKEIGKRKESRMKKMNVMGTIGNTNNMKPTKTTGKDGRPFMRFKMWVVDETKPKVAGKDGVERYPSESYQVNLPSNERGEKLFEMLAPNRRIFIEGGDLDHNPNEYIDPETDEKRLYANPVVKLNRGQLHFLDAPPMLQAGRDVNTLIKKKFLDEDQREEAMKALRETYANRNED